MKQLQKKEYTKDDIQSLFEWKNGMRLSGSKQKSLDEKIIKKLSVINHLKATEKMDLDLFQNEFKSLTAVWKIFLLHCIKPNYYPIYDQHIHRTFLFIHQEDFSTISNYTINNKEKEDFYFNRYLPFIKSILINDLKKLDEAFFSFGQFLNTKNYKHLFTTKS